MPRTITNYEIIELNYKRGYWTKQQVADMITAGHINEIQYKEIVGEDYQSLQPQI